MICVRMAQSKARDQLIWECNLCIPEITVDVTPDNKQAN